MRSALGVLAAWLTFVAIWVALMTALLFAAHQAEPDKVPWPPNREARLPDAWLAGSLVVDLLAAEACGAVLAWITRRIHPLRHVIVTALVLALPAMIGQALLEADQLPAWVSWARVAIVPASMISGGVTVWVLLRNRQAAAAKA